MLSEKRYGRITGSKADVLFPKRSNPATQETYAKELARGMYFEFRDEVNTWQTNHGHYGEVIAMQEYQKSYPLAYKPDFEPLGDDFGGSADCLIPMEDFGVDFKCPTSMEKWLEYLEGCDHQQERQAQMYMLLYKKDKWKILAFLTETERMINDGVFYPVPSDKRFIEVVIEKDPTFEEELYKRAKPLLKKRDEEYQKLINQFGEKIQL